MFVFVYGIFYPFEITFRAHVQSKLNNEYVYSIWPGKELL